MSDPYDEERYECENCGTYLESSEVCEFRDGIYCCECYDELIDEKIEDSHYRPLPRFKKMERDDDLFMGFELEVEMDDERDRKSSQLTNYLEGEGVADVFYLKEDGSLDNGFELVSHPITLNYLRKKLKMKKILKWLKQNKFETNYNCGLHVHINEKFLSKEDIIKLRAFFSLNKESLFKFSHRDDINNDYCQYEEFDMDMFLDEEEQEDRYWALNLNTGQNTVEVRIFSGTLDENRFLGYLEFVDSLVRYCKKNSLEKVVQYGDSSKSWEYFMNYLTKYKRKYKTTKQELHKDKLLNTTTQVLN